MILFALIAMAAPSPEYMANELSHGDERFLREARPFADCLVAHKAREIPKFLGTADNAWIGRDMRKSHPECPVPQASSGDTTLILEGAILESLIARDFGSVAPPANFDQVPPFVYIKDTANKYVEQDTAILMDTYDCATRREPSRVHALFETEPLSGREASALSALRATLIACYPKGETWELRPYFARRFLAEAYYSLMKMDQRRKAVAQ